MFDSSFSLLDSYNLFLFLVSLHTVRRNEKMRQTRSASISPIKKNRHTHMKTLAVLFCMAARFGFDSRKKVVQQKPYPPPQNELSAKQKQHFRRFSR